ncbi:MAG: ABC transporter ATP-binding protein [Spirochaetales bacterium]|nr:ABC transporter ATP-binding protein [Spirochaetales bacterium]
MSLSIHNLSYGYKQQEVLDRIAFKTNTHSITALLGPNGAGKSTLLKCINRILPYKKGTVLIDKNDVAALSGRQRAQRIGYVSQKTESVHMTVFDAVLLGRHPYMGNRVSKKDLSMVQSILKKLGMEPFALRSTDELSGGELQKVSIARALVQEPGLLLLDEPVSSLDLKNQIEILRLIAAIVKSHDVNAVMSVHDINCAIHYADTLIFLKDHHIHTVCKKNEVTKKIIQEVYDIEVTIHQTDDYPVVIPAHY